MSESFLTLLIASIPPIYVEFERGQKEQDIKLNEDLILSVGLTWDSDIEDFWRGSAIVADQVRYETHALTQIDLSTDSTFYVWFKDEDNERDILEDCRPEFIKCLWEIIKTKIIVV